MSTKEEKPTLAGVNVKTRKRNIVIPEDPGSFADAIVTLCQDAASDDGSAGLEADLEAAAKALDGAELEYSRYGDVLFQVFFAGGRLGTGAQLAAEDKMRLATNILAAEATREAINPYFKLFQTLTRRRPFLIRGLENTLVKLMLSLEFFDDVGRKKLGIALALTFSWKIGVVPGNIFAALLNDRLVAKGTVLEVMIVFFQEFLAKDTTLDDLVSILAKANIANRLMDFAPPNKRTPHEYHLVLKAAGLNSLVEWDVQREIDLRVSELQDALTEAIAADPPLAVSEVLNIAKSKKQESNLPDGEVLRVSWLALMKSINLTGKNQQQITQALMQKLKSHGKLFATFATNAKAELALLNTIQVFCYEDTRMLKCFTDIMKLLYNAEIVGEDTIQHWYKKGSHTKGRAVFLKDIEPFMKWLEEAEEDDE
ncbi:hypothetical protein CHLRE_06g298350v5 [Chlamydomonas reinhardtii]|jgi:hypothetical protein|uniref:Uncharacterized protein n=1 Tax=Chlamydomonas reinhardtii TaxID=3055 RepID=A8IP37_CHLRE|nr:uncharacterized protein CHLRE_06g298350v5 [Chlamydomonas reinhardtii]PNW82888.1 hypothetical protein CHLRE_06g298350v5 [Chlamydomonas reinhardtii]|eukprot:XP_001691456.1 flagellar associated protein [Chlamydomonas reinhardtii]